VAVLSVLQAGVIPLAAAGAYAARGWAAVPPAFVAADVAVAVAAGLIARPGSFWPRGWLPAGEYVRLFRFGLTVALSQTLFSLFNNMLPYLMNVRGYTPAAVGFLGLGTRVSGFAQGALSAMASSLYQTLSVMMARDGIERAARWQDLCTRFGSLVILAAVGACGIAGPWVAPRVWGPAFHGVETVIGLCLGVVFLLWHGSQALRLLLLLKRPRVYLLAVLGLLTGFGLVFSLVRPDGTGRMAVAAMAAGATVFTLTANFALGGWAALLRKLVTYGLPVLFTVGAWWAGARLTATGAVFGALLAWGLGYGALAFALRLVRWYEIRDVWHAIRGAKAVAPDAAPLD
jgi:O-antigen/teichoic acid export membrane protein